jgi:hypothetical protein
MVVDVVGPVLHGVDDRAGAQKEQGLEKGVGLEVKDPGQKTTDAQGHHHVT